VLEKQQLDLALKGLKKGGLAVTFWDGTTKHYGPDKAQVAITLNDPEVIKEIRRSMDLGVGEAYMDGRLEVKGDLAQLTRIGDENNDGLIKYLGNLGGTKRKTSTKTNFKDVQHHYDLGNDFYRLWLDKSMTYSCAYFTKKSDTLEAAQRQKVDHILKKLALKRGMTVLDIGSGWGELIIRAAKKYGVKSHGITLSKEQHAATKARIRKEKLTGTVSVELKHYADLKRRPFDRVVSVGMYEHVGQGNHAKYFQAVDRLLKPGGISMLHTITQFEPRETSPWINKYIFPGGYLPTVPETMRLMVDYDFHAVDYESLRRHYALTLDEWSKRFERHLPEVRKMYDERFIRMWRLYLRGSYAGFQYGNLDLAQILFTKGLSDQVPLTRQHVYR
jgi:cyclopropane-fatty-acyl-phospholipid synthase